MGETCPEGPRYCPPLYINWHTGQRVEDDSIHPIPRNVNTPALEAFTRTFPAGVARVTQSGGKLELVTGRTHVLLAQCGNTCGLYEFRAGMVVWGDSRAVYGYDIRHHLRYTWRFHGPLPSWVAPTPYEVVFSVQRGPMQGPARLFAARRTTS